MTDNPFDTFQREDFTIFDIEEALLERSLMVLADETTSPDMLRAELRVMTNGYQRLFREVQRLIKLSDRKELELNRLNRELLALSEQLDHQASHDQLTGIFNRRALNRHIDEAIQHRPFGLILFDLDHFKQVNDRYGHPCGDAVLKGFAERIREQLLPEMIFARIGGEEFAVTANDMPLDELHAFAEKLRRATASAPFNTLCGFVEVTASFGVSRRVEGEAFSAVFHRTDTALYQAKTQGRNHVISLAPSSTKASKKKHEG